MISGLSSLLDEDSGNSLEDKLNGFIDKVEGTLGTTLDKAENGVRRADHIVSKLEKGADQVEAHTQKATDIITKKQ